jgi:collagenase-like PrtC family protease
MSRRTSKKAAAGALTLGPVLYNWEPALWRDFYFRIADEAPVDTVVVGEVVCSKREPFFEPQIPRVVERLEAAGKEVVLAGLALVTNRREMATLEELATDAAHVVEANDIAAIALLQGRPHDVGPHVNVYNEGTLAWLARRGARRVALPIELSMAQIAAIAARRGKVEIEVFAFGRAPLALSARCYSARARGLRKDNCQFVCAGMTQGMALETLDAKPFLVVNGTTTMSATWIDLAAHVGALRQAGVGRLRLSPEVVDMVAVARVFRGLLDGADPKAAQKALARLAPQARFSDGFLRGTTGADGLAA